ncbi:MAG: helicase-associated domain-containing protein [Spirochaetes bacterium]|nr:helicase-associated domain-containing protein [Spirochaetota bacterium]
MIKHLNTDERKILHLAHEDKNGITYEHIKRNLQIESDKIEKYTDNLSNLLLVYVLKNRQKLNNKLDKVYLLPEIYDILNPLNEHLINKNFSDVYSSLIKNETNNNELKQVVKNPYIKCLNSIFNSGGILPLEDFEEFVPEKNIHKVITDLLNIRYIHVFHDLYYSGKTYITLDKKIYVLLTHKNSDTRDGQINVQNRYNTLLNLLKTFDTVSTYGLFLTKQNHFRKIDKKHLEESMIDIHGMDGSPVSHIFLAQLSLYFLFIQDCVKISNNSVLISLKKINKLINDPYTWHKTLIKHTDDPLRYDTLFKPPVEIPETRTVMPFIDFLEDNNNKTSEYLEAAYYAELYSKIKDTDFLKFREFLKKNIRTFQLVTSYLCITGIININNNRVCLSDIGERIIKKDSDKQKGREVSEALHEENAPKNVYLNPDFTLIIPKKEIDSEALYHILTHTEIIKDDIILHTRISRESILTALKREMTNDNLFATLKRYLKTEIPDNLNFLMSEWLSQTIRLNVFNACIINTNISFLDKISHSKIKNCIVKRLTDEYAIIDRKYLDKLIRMAKESDALINIFDEYKDVSDSGQVSDSEYPSDYSNPSDEKHPSDEKTND